jgi:hypothetical protein
VHAYSRSSAYDPSLATGGFPGKAVGGGYDPYSDNDIIDIVHFKFQNNF